MSSLIDNHFETSLTTSADYLKAMTHAQFVSLKERIADGSDSVVRVDTTLVHSYPIDCRFRLYSQRLFLAILKISQATWALMPESERDQILTMRRSIQFQASISQLHAVLALKSNDFARIYESLHQLYDAEFKFDVMKEGSSDKEGFAFSRFIGQYIKLDNNNGVRWEFLSDVLPLVVNPTVWAEVDLRVVSQLKSRGALSLYCNTVRYLRNPSKLTAKRPLKEWVYLLTPSYVTANRFAKEKGYSQFNFRVLQPALQELEELSICPFRLELLEDATSKLKVFALQFKLHLKETPSVPENNDSSENNEEQPDCPIQPIFEDMDDTLAQWGVRADALANLRTTKDEEFLAAVFATVREALAHNPGSVTNPGGAFMSAAKNGYIPTYSVENKASFSEPPSLFNKEEEERERLISEYSKQRQLKAREFFALQAESLQNHLKAMYFDGPDCDEATRALYLQEKALNLAMVSVPFFSWLAKQPGTLAQWPELASVELFDESKREFSSRK